MKLNEIGGTTERGIHGLSKGMAWVAAGIIFLMMFLVTADVAGRYVFNKPIKGALEIAELMMVLLVFLAMSYCTLKAGHVVVDLVTSRLSSRTNAILNVVTSLASAVIVGFIAWQLGMKGWREVVSSSSRLTLLLQIPEAPFYLVAAIGSLIACVELLIHSFHSLGQAQGR